MVPPADDTARSVAIAASGLLGLCAFLAWAFSPANDGMSQDIYLWLIGAGFAGPLLAAGGVHGLRDRLPAAAPAVAAATAIALISFATALLSR